MTSETFPCCRCRAPRSSVAVKGHQLLRKGLCGRGRPKRLVYAFLMHVLLGACPSYCRMVPLWKLLLEDPIDNGRQVYQMVEISLNNVATKGLSNQPQCPVSWPTAVKSSLRSGLVCIISAVSRWRNSSSPVGHGNGIIGRPSKEIVTSPAPNLLRHF